MKLFRIKNLLFIGLSLTLFSCWKSSEWTENERNVFKKKCTETKTFKEGSICFTGFDFNEVNKIKVIEKYKSKPIDTFYIYAEKFRDNHDSIYKQHWADVNKEFNVKNSYEFNIGKDKPYILDNMEMIMWAQYTMGGEGWGCEMGNFTIDNEKFEDVGNIVFTKRGIKRN